MSKRSGRVTDEWTDLSRGTNDDVIVTYVKRNGDNLMRFINVYNQRDTQTGE